MGILSLSNHVTCLKLDPPSLTSSFCENICAYKYTYTNRSMLLFTYLVFTVSGICCQLLGDYTNKSIECKQGTFQNYHLMRDHYHKSFSCTCCYHPRVMFRDWMTRTTGCKTKKEKHVQRLNLVCLYRTSVILHTEFCVLCSLNFEHPMLMGSHSLACPMQICCSQKQPTLHPIHFGESKRQNLLHIDILVITWVSMSTMVRGCSLAIHLGV